MCDVSRTCCDMGKKGNFKGQKMSKFSIKLKSLIDLRDCRSNVKVAENYEKGIAK